MPIPEFHQIKAPALQFFVTDGKPHKVSEIYDVLGKHFNLTENELNEVLPSGKHLVFLARPGCAVKVA